MRILAHEGFMGVKDVHSISGFVKPGIFRESQNLTMHSCAVQYPRGDGAPGSLEVSVDPNCRAIWANCNCKDPGARSLFQNCRTVEEDPQFQKA